MLRRVALLRTDVSDERSAYTIRVTRMGELGTTLRVMSIVLLRSVRRLLVSANVVPISPILVTLMDGGARFLRNVRSYKIRTA
jgi:hypothetical protein